MSLSSGYILLLSRALPQFCVLPVKKRKPVVLEESVRDCCWDFLLEGIRLIRRKRKENNVIFWHNFWIFCKHLHGIQITFHISRLASHLQATLEWEGVGIISVISRYMFCWTPAEGRQVTLHRLSNLDRCHHSRMDKGSNWHKAATWDSHLPLLFQTSCFPENFRELHLGWDDGQKVKEASSSFINMWLTPFLPLAFRIIYVFLHIHP